MNFEKVLSVKHYSDRLFSFTTTRETFTKPFLAGQFTMIGMGDDDILRAYSIASPPDADYLEFLSIKVDDGPLTSRLQHIQPGQEIEVMNRPTGTLVLKNLLPGKRLWCVATGTGLAPFMSIVRDSSMFSQYSDVIVTHTVREVAELAYCELLESLPIRYYPTVTREPFRQEGRITDHIVDHRLFETLGVPRWSPEHDRVMICGSPEFNQQLRQMLELTGFSHGTNRAPGHFVQERAFVSQHTEVVSSVSVD